MEEVISCCGAVCSQCKDYPRECGGCPAIQGKVFWLQYVPEDVCPIYACCVEEKGLAHCGGCEELPCERYSRYSDPNMSEEEGAKLQEEAFARLRSLPR
ncbi:DUF3795 domain-containing protein [Christensenella intestinihominis]|uniref:DUF3795 domain-containing protein n=1 Tax=Christensenella intestinihominis TaxID=1851429 RepID=UPI00082AE6F1|nr:DUF3795 domain-containing protein [Christensenella intestinihominis]